MIYKVNFLPPNLQREGNIDLRRLFLISGVTLIVTLLAISCGFLVINFFVMNNQLRGTQQQLAELAPVVDRVEKITSERKELEKTIDQYNFLLKRHVVWSDMFYDYNNISPVDLWLNSVELSYKPDLKVTIGSSPVITGKEEQKQSSLAGSGQSVDIQRPNQVDFKGASLTMSSIGVFINNLYQLPYFKEVKLIKASRESQGITFQITALLKDDL
ncbi:MAG TPA: hypothetical protein DCK76_01795 [Desulfotomaculum sp.]|nr:MAG: Fimbrial assembly family protein [Desulfotomaculum sp. 46_296]HAG10133.1 hypothetical protein [Desulfotomaculum sp.]HBY03676.1 hypothetical protein [Desulfotomaculum sp.]